MAGQFPLVEEFVTRLGYEAAQVILKGRGKKNARPEVIMARDSRESGGQLGRWLAKGLAAAGCRVTDIGLAPTPSIACLVPRRKAAFGAVISASHNPPEFNGIKFFSADGTKLDEELEDAIEARMEGKSAMPAAKEGEHLSGEPQAVALYEDFLAATMPEGETLAGMTIVVDCANGAASELAPRLFKRLGATVHALACAPDGKNINAGVGALHTGTMQRETVKRNAHCGFSLDGDADRVIFSDELGNQLDGDDIIATAALEMHREHRLKNNRVVFTVMSNSGIINKLKEAGITCAQVPVGDKYVSQAMEKEDLSIGGEASGHIIFRDFLPTGDGLLTAVQLLALLKLSGRKLSEFKSLLPKYPQSLRALTVKTKVPLEDIPGFDAKLREHESALDGGRIFVRYSGTEPKLRVLVEGPDKTQVEAISQDIIQYYKKQTEEEICR